ncbi:MAG: NUDIX domain-containing protein [Patescibacteria group bacterium]|nr:NUDIX domain-containing protein [Patescibacteria group bacterium]
MKREFSAGGIVFNSQGQVLLTQNSANKYWGFPKGWVDKGESTKEAALREVKEEGGVEAEIVDKIADSRYVFTSKESGEKVFKVVTFYLMKYLSGDPQNHDWEVEEAGWFEPEEAFKKLSFSQDKSHLKKALEMYKS